MSLSRLVGKYRAARERYKPEKLRVLFVAESPPASGAYFYFDDKPGHLFRETMRAVGLWPEDRKMPRDVQKKELLRKFRDKGYYLIDASLVPVDDKQGPDRRRMVAEGVPRLVREVEELGPEAIVIVKASIYGPVRSGLERAGFGGRLLNLQPLRFPSHGNQESYRKELRKLLA